MERHSRCQYCLHLSIAALFGGLFNQLYTNTNMDDNLTDNLSTKALDKLPLKLLGLNKNKKQQVLLLSYGRSGTTYTSALISHNPEVFYSPEPLYQGNGPDINDSKAALDIVRGVLECNPLDVDPTTYSYDVMAFSNSTIQFGKYILKYPTLSAGEFLRKFLDMWNRCKEQPVTYVKTIRTRMEWARQLMEQLPDLKILYLIRDPRAMLYSQRNNFFRKTDIDYVAHRSCSYITKDLKVFHELSKTFPERTMGLRYEDGAVAPQQYARHIYRFLGFAFNEQTSQFIDQISAGTKNRGRAYGFEKKSSSRAMSKWRLTIPMDDVITIDTHCRHLYQDLGYKQTNDTVELRDRNVSLLNFEHFEGMFKPVV